MSRNIIHIFSTLTGYCFDLMDSLVTSDCRDQQGLKAYMAELKLTTPPPLAATSNRPDKNEAIRTYVSRFDRTELVH